jgi:hypothetical protein
MTGQFTSVENINRVRELRIRRIGQPRALSALPPTVPDETPGGG